MNSLETHVLRLIGEDVDSPDVFTDTTSGIAPVRDSLNDAVQELCMVTGSYKRVYHLPLNADALVHKLTFEADHFGWISEAWDRERKFRLEQTGLLKLNIQDPDWMTTTGYPEQYVQIGHNYLIVYRKQSSDGTVLELDCVCIPKPYTGENDPVRVRQAFERAAVYYAAGEFYASRGDAKRALEYHARYLETANLKAMNPDTAERSWQWGGWNGGGQTNAQNMV